MIYFARIELRSPESLNNGLAHLIIETSEGSQPELSTDALKNNGQYKEYISNKKIKNVHATYQIYETEDNLTNATSEEIFEQTINAAGTKLIGSGELSVATRVKKKKKTSALVIVISVCISALVFSAIGIIVGKKLLAPKPVSETEGGVQQYESDGMIIPAQDVLTVDAEQITVTIDRSYSSVPVEDLQLKGAVVDGKAEIELPSFDKTDFFSHVAGYTWGFSTNPDADRIEYYSGGTYSFSKDIKLYRVLVKYGGGSGTKDDPYLIDYFDQLELMSEEKARGYFRQTADIEFPVWAKHTPIDTINELKEEPQKDYFSYDGGGYCIDGITSALFGTVSGAVIENVNIRNSVITTYEYGNFGAIVCECRNYQYANDSGKFSTGETIIRNCSVSHTSLSPSTFMIEEETEPTNAEVIPADSIEYDENGNLIEKDKTTEKPTETPKKPTKSAEYCIGAISGVGGQIENCYVTDFGIFANQDSYYLYAGGISGMPSSVTNSAVYFYSAQGRIFNAGGIAGSANGCKQYNAAGHETPVVYGGNIQGCVARNVVLTPELSAGGITAMGTSDSDTAIISNCYANELLLTAGEYDKDGKLITAGVNGGIIGIDGTEGNGHLITNCVSLADYSVIGKKSKSVYDSTVRQAPAYAFYQENILSVINSNSVNDNKPKEIFTGEFIFGDGEFGDESGRLAYPEKIKELFAKTIIENNNGG